MNAFIEQNKKLFKLHYTLARMIGNIIITLGIVAFLSLVVTQLPFARINENEDLGRALGTLQRSWYILAVTGLIALGVGQCIRYVYDAEYRPGWLLNYGHVVLYIFAVTVVTHMIGMIVFRVSRHEILNIFVLLLNILPMLLLNTAKLLVLIGLAQILKRIMPVIEESRTLV